MLGPMPREAYFLHKSWSTEANPIATTTGSKSLVSNYQMLLQKSNALPSQGKYAGMDFKCTGPTWMHGNDAG